MKKIILAISSSLIFFACEKEIKIDLNSTNPQIVIQGNITDKSGPYFVKINKTVNFSDNNNYPAVSNALVVISDNTGIIDTLKETQTGVYQTQKTVGQAGRSYQLRIVADGKEYNAISYMPNKVNLDTLILNKAPVPGSTTDNYAVVPIYLDPASKGNCYRFVQTVNNKIDGTYYVFNDDVNNGVMNQRPIFGQDANIKQSDSVSIEMRCIDIDTYNYFFTLSQIAGNGPGGGTTPSNPPNNITGTKALGYFSAYTTQTKKVKVP
jgi:hypothetical protein